MGLNYGELLTRQQHIKNKEGQDGTEEVQKQHHDTYEYLFNHYPDPVYIGDNEGNIISMNNAALNRFGYKPRNIKDKRFILKQYLNRTLEYFNEALRGEVQTYNSKKFHKNGSLIETNVTLFPITNESKVEEIVAIVKDITKLKQPDHTINKWKKILTMFKNSLILEFGIMTL